MTRMKTWCLISCYDDVAYQLTYDAVINVAVALVDGIDVGGIVAACGS